MFTAAGVVHNALQPVDGAPYGVQSREHQGIAAVLELVYSFVLGDQVTVVDS